MGHPPRKTTARNVLITIAIILAITGFSLHSSAIEQDGGGFTALHRAVMEGKPMSVTFWLAMGADVNARSQPGLTPLHLAATSEVAAILVNRGAGVNAQTTNGDTPLHFAAQYQRSGMIDFLLSHGANPNLANVDGETPLLLAVKNHDLATVALLLAAKADPNCRNADGITPLAAARKAGQARIVTALLNNGARTR